MKPSGADILWSCLVEQGVDTVFGYPGGAILPAYDRASSRCSAARSACLP